MSGETELHRLNTAFTWYEQFLWHRRRKTVNVLHYLIINNSSGTHQYAQIRALLPSQHISKQHQINPLKKKKKIITGSFLQVIRVYSPTTKAISGLSPYHHSPCYIHIMSKTISIFKSNPIQNATSSLCKRKYIQPLRILTILFYEANKTRPL